jgi:UDP-2,3-diacylglucosamine pyrophosphatase LpxH
MAKEFYFVSDMHMGGDGNLMECDYAEEFIGWLRTLEQRATPDTELIIMGDTFGLWESTQVKYVDGAKAIIATHKPIFDQLKRVGEKMKITMMVGNHDYDLACDPAYGPLLKEYNITLDTSLTLWREVGNRMLCIEHGQQADSFNAAPDYGNRYALPSGFFITETAVSGASKYSVHGATDWLKDIRSVGTMQIPDWIFSNYFYREMRRSLRWLLIPFLLMLGLAVFVLIAQVLKWLGIFDVNILLNNRFINSLGIVGNVLQLILFIDMLALLVFLIAGIPLYLVLRDVRRVLERFQLVNASGQGDFNPDSNEPYLQRARQVFQEKPDAAVYLFGHTHAAFLQQENGRVILNTGSWLKLLHRVSVRFGKLPPVYFPSFRLSVFHIYGEGDKIVIEYEEVDKKPEQELSNLQRTLLLGKKPAPPKPIPARTTI